MFLFLEKVVYSNEGLYMVSIQRWVGAISKTYKNEENSSVRVFNAKL